MIQQSTFSGIIAHRGASHYAPENTLAALRKAKELGSTWVECDVMLTADHVPIIFHDLTLQRTTNGRGKIAKKQWAAIQKLDAGLWFHPTFKGEKVPTLAEYMAEAALLQLSLNIELKVNNEERGQREILVQKVLETTEPYKTSVPVLFSSFDIPTLRLLQTSPEGSTYARGINLVAWQQECPQEALDLGCYAINIPHKVLSVHNVSFHTSHTLRPQGLGLFIYTVNDPRDARALLANGVTGVFSDDPHLLSKM